MECSTLWEHCLFFLAGKAQEKREAEIAFVHVDSLALEVSKHLTPSNKNYNELIQHVWNTSH